MDIDNKRAEVKKIPPPKVRHKIWIGSYIVLAAVCLLFYFFLRLPQFRFNGVYASFSLRLLLCGSVVFFLLAVSQYAEHLIKKFSQTPSAGYNLLKLSRILTVLAIIMTLVAFSFQRWYTAAVSLGLFSLILGFALQSPISSLIGWLYIIIRTPYKAGDRIQVGSFKGDVVEISYLDTTLWEFGGDYLTNDVPSGRLIRFPNTVILQSEVYNYSWRKFPFIWNEIPFHIAYESDFGYVEEVLRAVAKKVLGKGMDEKVRELKMLVEQTPVDELTIREYPFVTFRTNANTWVEASVNYLVDPKQASIIRSKIIKETVARLLQEPDRVMFPKSNAR